MINVVCGIGSTGRLCTDQAEELERQGNKVRIAYGRGQVPDRYKRFAVRIGNNTDVRLHALRSRIIDGAGFGSRGVTERFLDWVRSYDPDEIRLHNLHGYYLNIEVLFNYLKTCGKPIIWTLHDCWAYTGHCTHYMVPGCEKWRTQCKGHCPEKRSYPASLLFSRCAANFRRKKAAFSHLPDMQLITPSKWLAGEVEKSFLREYPVQVVYNTVDTNVFRPVTSSFRNDHRLDDKKIILGVAGRWTSRKGFDDYLKLADLLGSDYQLVLVGVTARQKKTLDDHQLLGIERTENAGKLAGIYSTADYFVNLTYEDNYPSVNLEARACGTRVITYDTGGCAETVEGYGIVVPTGDLEQVAGIIRMGKDGNHAV